MNQSLHLMLVLGLLSAGAALALTGPQSSDDLTDIQERGRAATQWFYDGEFDKLLELGLTVQMSEAMQGGDALPGIQEQMTSMLGAEQEVLEEQVVEAQGMQVYVRTVRYEKVERAVVQWAFDDQLRIGGFFIRPAQ